MFSDSGRCAFTFTSTARKASEKGYSMAMIDLRD
jgi:hypothetical protein